MVQCGVVAAWAVLLTGGWGLATALLVASAVSGFDWFGRVAGSVMTEAPGTRGVDACHQPARRRRRPDGPAGRAWTWWAARPRCPSPRRASRCEPSAGRPHRGPRRRHHRRQDVDLTVGAGELVLLLGQVGSGKSSLLSALAGLVSQHREVPWNGRALADPEASCGRAGSPTSPRCRGCCPAPSPATSPSTTPTGGSCRPSRRPAWAGTSPSAGGPEALVGHRGVRLSGGQVQRLALARALACDADLLLADDVSSALDAATEIELWAALRRRGATVIGATSKAAALAQADRVVVLVEGRVAAVGPWSRALRQVGPPRRLARAPRRWWGVAALRAPPRSAHETASQVSRGPRPARPAGSPR